MRFPIDLSRWSAEEIEAVAATINSPPRKVLGWKTPAEASTNTYACSNKPVLHPPVEPGEYTGHVFALAYEAFEITQSMGRVGSALDNAVAKSFNSILEHELLSRRHFTTKEQARREIAAFIDAYNHRRRHSSAEMMAPCVTSRFSPPEPPDRTTRRRRHETQPLTSP